MGQCVSQKQSSQSQRRSEHSSSRCVVKVASANKTKVVSRWCCTILLFHRSKSRSHRRDEDIPTRRATSGKTLELTIPVEGNDSFKVKYAFISQPGYYPDQISKPNQDKYCVRENFRNHSGEAFFGVYDGHGEHGADCADFVAQTLPDNVKSSAYLQPSGNLDMSNYARAFLRTNEQLEVEPTIDDVMSGTTAVTLHIIGEKLVVSNVGDSRACMGVYTEDGLVTKDLTRDHTPFRADEQERVEKQGAIIMSLEQIEGRRNPNYRFWEEGEGKEEGDPPRIWASNGIYPGTAFTRSLGDSAAESLGVIAEPELTIANLTSEVSFVVAATDGVYEFLTSEAVANIISQFEDLHEGCSAVVQEAYRLWLQFETRTDDITIVALAFEGLPQKPHEIKRAPSEKRTRPLRKMPMENVKALLDDEDIGPDNMPVPASKTEEEMEAIGLALRGNFLFSNLDEEKKQRVYQAIGECEYKAKDIVLRQGERGDAFYILQSGILEVYVKPDDPYAELDNELGKHVYTYQVEGSQHPSFGELALIHNQPRSASVIAKTDCKLWFLNRPTFKHVLRTGDDKTTLRILRKVKILEPLNMGELQKLHDYLTETTFSPGEYILRQGEVGRTFYVIKEGEVVCQCRSDPSNDAEEPREIMRLGENQYLGERALMSDSTRAADVKALTTVRCLCIERDSFEKVLGSLSHLMSASRQWRERISAQQSKKAKSLEGYDLRGTSPDHLHAVKVHFSHDSGALMTGWHPGLRSYLTLYAESLSLAVKYEVTKQTARMRQTMRSIMPMSFIPPFHDLGLNQKWWSVALQTEGRATLSSLLRKPLSREAAAFYTATATLALEHIHHLGYIFRGLSPHTILLDIRGHIQLVDFRFAKKLDGRTYTLCGDAEFVAPEMVKNTGHDTSADWWSLGVFTWWLLRLTTPFLEEANDDLQIYKKIANGSYQFPDEFSEATRKFLLSLLQRDPNERMSFALRGVDSLKQFDFFKGINLDELLSPMADSTKPPSELYEAVPKGRPVGCSLSPEGVAEYRGNIEWLAGF